jgi:hypothetical protein
MPRRSRGKPLFGLVISIGVSPDDDKVGVLLNFIVFFFDKIKYHQELTVVTLLNVFHDKRQENKQLALFESLRPDVFNGALLDFCKYIKSSLASKKDWARKKKTGFELNKNKSLQCTKRTVPVRLLIGGILPSYQFID